MAGRKTKVSKPKGKGRGPLPKLQVREVTMGGERMVIVPHRLWERMLEQLEELYDLQCHDDACAEVEDPIEHDELCTLLERSPLLYYRHRAGLSQEALGKEVDLSPSYIAKIEVGARRLTEGVAKKLAAALDVPLSKLMPKA